MTQQDDFLGGLHYDRVPEAEVGPAPGVVRYPPAGVRTGPVRPRVSAWWHVAGFVLGAVAAALGALAWGYALDQFDEVRLRGLVALGLAGLLVGLVSLGKLSPAAPLAAGLAALGVRCCSKWVPSPSCPCSGRCSRAAARFWSACCWWCCPGEGASCPQVVDRAVHSLWVGCPQAGSGLRPRPHSRPVNGRVASA